MVNGDERTESPTPRRLERARREGEVPRSAMASAFGAVAALPVAAYALWWALGSWPTLLRAALAAVSDTRSAQISARAVLDASLPTIGAAVVAGFAIACATAVGATVVCGLPLPSAARLRPNFRRLVPASAFARFGSREQWRSAALGLLAACGVALVETRAGMHAAARREPGALLGMWLSAVGVIALAAGLDVWSQRRRAARAMMMTKREVRDERRETDGRPEVKARRSSVVRRQTRTLRLAAIRRATVVVTNPTHVAVALRYAPPLIDVPIVVARGAGVAAATLRALAGQFDVPVVEQPDLARSLYAQVEIDRAIPPWAYAIVAQMFARLVREHGSLRGSQNSA